MPGKREPYKRRTPEVKNGDAEELYRAIAKYLDGLGWSALVMGSPRILQSPSDFANNFQFCVNFTGGKKPDPETSR